MKISQIITESTTAGSVASVAMPIGGAQKRSGTLFKGKKTKKKFYEGKVKELSMDLKKPPEGLSDSDFKKKYNKTKQEWSDMLKKKNKDKPVSEAELQEDDLILVPGQGFKRKSGFVPHGQSRVDHEVEMARSDVLATMKNAKAIYELLKSRSEEEGLEGWVQEKLIKANDYLNAVKEYYDEKLMQKEMMGGVVAGGGVGESVVSEKAVSKQQQKFMGMVHAVQKGEMKAPSKAVAKAAKGMTKKAGHEFAATKHKGLPDKVKKDKK